MSLLYGSGQREWRWTFLEVQGVEPKATRELSFGTQSEKGRRFVETMLTSIETCRQQNLFVIDLVSRPIQNHFEKQ
jgi:hypothetical protein